MSWSEVFSCGTKKSYQVTDVVDFQNNSSGPGLQIGDEVQLEQIFNWKELFGWEGKNHYELSSNDGRKLHIAEVENDDMNTKCHRQCCKARREWNLQVRQGPEPSNPELLSMRKNQECFIECCGKEPTPCFAPRVLQVMQPGGQVMATADQTILCERGCCNYDIHVNVAEKHKYSIQGSQCQMGQMCAMCADAKYEITTAEGQPVGQVVRPAITCAELCKKTNRLQVKFPQGADPTDKAALLGGTMLYEIFEEMNQQQQEENQQAQMSSAANDFSFNSG
jgi:hypothetical protein